MLKFLKNSKTNEFRMTLTNDVQEDEVELKANSTDAAKEKHVPEIDVRKDEVEIRVGSTLHPMTSEHLIEDIILVTSDKVVLKKLTPSDQPVAKFRLIENEKVLKAYAYCNLHGLWVKEL